MRTSLLIVFLLLRASLCNFAQEIQLVDTTRWLCTYDYKFLKDSTSLSSLKSEQMILQVGSHLSKFESSRRLCFDSLSYIIKGEDFSVFSKKIETAINNNGVPHFLCDYKIYKNFPAKGGVEFSAFMGGKYFRVTQHKAFNWKIDKKDTLLLGYHCQMAHISYAGRNYVAWFTSEIPISDGPYKFHGLPGLIIKISDTKNQHCFTLIKIQKLKYIQPILYSKSNFVDVCAEEYVKALYSNIIRLSGMVISNDITIPEEEHKTRSIHNLRSINNFIERY